MKNKGIKIYQLGHWTSETYAIPCNRVKDIDEARDIILHHTYAWQDKYTDEEYIEKFSHPKRNIEVEKVGYIRFTGQWVSMGYECAEWDWIMEWNETQKIGRGAIKCYIFCLNDLWGDYGQITDEEEINDK